MGNEDLTRSDGLIAPRVGAWAQRKYNLLEYYSKMFSTSMKDKWGSRVYIDLFAGAGKAYLEGTNRIVNTSPLIALGVPDKFDKYIYCEEDPVKLEALRRRIETQYPEMNTHFICGDANDVVDEILTQVPMPRTGRSVLSFCFADPYKAENLRFNTIRSISKIFVDFIILLPIYMDINRNIHRYLHPSNIVIDAFVGTSEWKPEWVDAKKSGKTFDEFFTVFYRKRMETIGFMYGGFTEIIRSNVRNLPLYRFGCFSRHPLGIKFWDRAVSGSNPQMELGL